GTVVHTADGGESWEAQQSRTAAELRDVAFIDASNGWAVGQGGTIVHTNNGGGSWETQFSGTEAGLEGVAFVDANNGWAVGDGGTILHTSDGGQSWQQQESGTGHTFNSVAFTDTNNGWVVGGGGTILHTNDGGQSWRRQVSYVNSHLIDITFADAHHGWAVGEGGVIINYQARPVADSWQLYVNTGPVGSSVIPTPEDFGEYEGLVPDAETLLEGRSIPGEYPIYGFRTWVYVEEAVNIPVVLSGDDTAALYVNGELVASTRSHLDRTFGEIVLAPGWSEIEVLVNDSGGGSFGLSLDTKIGGYVDILQAEAP
ncbi:MAG: YCF48-related protein, partial [Dehalococcoidia bacterium]